MTSDFDGGDETDTFGADDCIDCGLLRLFGPDPRAYSVIPRDGGGWQTWAAALLRLFRRIGNEPTQAVIITQPVLNNRYVQVLIGHGIAHAETSSNVYLTDNSRLPDGQNQLLDRLGWVAPASDFDDPLAMPANWTLPLIRGDWQHLVEMLVATAVGILGFSEHLPVEVATFLCDNPCPACSWGDELEAA